MENDILTPTERQTLRALLYGDVDTVTAAFAAAIEAELRAEAPFLYPDDADDEISFISDAQVYGALDPALLDRELSLGISPHGSKTQPGRWRNWKTTVRDMLTRLSMHEIGEKDGNCFLQGGTIDGERKANAIPHLDLLVLDLDTGENIDAIRRRLQELGLFGVIYTTHSHMKPITDIKKDAVVKWLGDPDANPTVEQVCDYLMTVKRYQPAVLEGAELMEAQHTAEGVKLFVKHCPMPKFRVVLLLKERFVVMERPGTQQQAITEWKERYAGASKLLGAFFDRSCVDPSRLFFLPRHPKGASEYRVEVIAGKPLDIETLERVSQKELMRGGGGAFEQALASESGGRDYKTDSMLWFFKRFGDLFDIETFLLDVDGDGDRGARSSGRGRTHRCPNDDEHSNAGDDNDVAFFCVNATESETGKATAHCRHDSCSQMDRIDFVDLICEKVGITTADELKRWVPEIVEDEDANPGNNPYSNPAEAERAVADETTDLLCIAVNVGMSGFQADTLLKLKETWLKRAGKARGPGAWNALIGQGQNLAGELAKTAAKEIKAKKLVEAGDAWLPDDVERRDGNFVSCKVVGKGANASIATAFVCKAFEPVERTVAPNNVKPGLLIRFGDKEIAIGAAQLHGSKDELARFLHHDNGMRCGTCRDSHDALAELLGSAMHFDKLPEVTEAQTPGWFSPVIWACANGKVVGSDTIRLSKNTGYTERAPKGVGDVAREQAIYDEIWTSGPDLWRFGDLLGLAAPCQNVVGCHRSGGIIPDGANGSGKTTFAHAQVARAGSPDESVGKGGLIRVTDTPESIEIPLRNATGSPFALDELGHMKDHSLLGRFLYGLAGGSGKLRMKRSADGMRDKFEWECISSAGGEKGISDLIRAAGKTMPGGLVRRFPNISVADLCPKSEDNRKLAHKVKETLFVNYGHTLPMFVGRALIGIDRQQANREWRALCVMLADKVPNLQEAAEFFALAWWAGRQAARVELTKGLTEAAVESVVKAAWKSFVESGAGDALEPGRQEIEALGESILDGWDRSILSVTADTEDGSFKERDGYYRAVASDGHPAGVFILQKHFDRLCGGTGSRGAVVKALEAGGWLTRSADGLPTCSYIHGVGKVRHYHLDYARFARADHDAGPFEKAAKVDG